MTPLVVFLIMVILFVILSPGIILNFPPIDNNWSDRSSYVSTGETTLVNAIVHGILYTVIIMSAMGLFLPYSNFYAPSHMYQRYKELYGAKAARHMGKQFQNLGQPSSLAGMPHAQTKFWSKITGKAPRAMSALGPRDPMLNKGCLPNPNNMNQMSPMMNPMMGQMMRPMMGGDSSN